MSALCVHHHHHLLLPQWIRSFDLLRHRRVAFCVITRIFANFPCQSRLAPRSTKPLVQRVPGPFPGVKLPGSDVNNLSTHPRASAEVKERVKVYLYSPSGSLWPVIRWTLPLPLPLHERKSEQSPNTQLEIHKCWPSWFELLKTSKWASKFNSSLSAVCGTSTLRYEDEFHVTYGTHLYERCACRTYPLGAWPRQRMERAADVNSSCFLYFMHPFVLNNNKNTFTTFKNTTLWT
jgi:hypothetical protein